MDSLTNLLIMGAYISQMKSVLTEHHTVSSYDKARLIKFLKFSDKQNIVEDCLKLFSRKYSGSFSQWVLLEEAIKILQEKGNFCEVIRFAAKQIELINDQKSVPQKNVKNQLDKRKILLSKSFLVLSQANFCISEYKKCLYYSEKSLKCLQDHQENPEAISITGFTTLWRGMGLLGQSELRKALGDFELSLAQSARHGDWMLQIMTSLSLGELYLILRDNEKALFFPLKALEIANEKQADDNILSLCQLSLAEAYRKVGKNSEAFTLCERALETAIDNENRRTQAYAMLCFADIHRMNRDSNKALPRYDLAQSLMIEIEDRYGQVLVYVGRAKALSKIKSYDKALQQFACSLELSLSIENKWMCVRVYGELAVLHQRLTHIEQAKAATLRYHQMLDDLCLFCAVCRQPFGEISTRIETIQTCSHFVHFRCLPSSVRDDNRICQICFSSSLVTEDH